MPYKVPKGMNVTIADDMPRTNVRLWAPKPVGAVLSVRGILFLQNDPRHVIVRLGRSGEKYGLIGGKLGVGEHLRQRLAIEAREEIGVRLGACFELTSFRNTPKLIAYPVERLAELGYASREYVSSGATHVLLDNPHTYLFAGHVIGRVPRSREGRQIRVIDVTRPGALEVLKREHRKAVQYWIEREFQGGVRMPFIETVNGKRRKH